MFRSYSFTEGVDQPVWGVFAGAISRDMEYSLEVINAIRRGEIKMDQVKAWIRQAEEEGVSDLRYYTNKVRFNYKLGESTRNKKFLHMSDMDSNDDSNSDVYEVSEEVVSKYTEQVDEFSRVDNNDEFYYAVNALSHMQTEILLQYPDSIEALRKLAKDAPHIGELIWIVLSSGVSVADLPQIQAA